MKWQVKQEEVTWAAIELESYGIELKKEKEEQNRQGWVLDML